MGPVGDVAEGEGGSGSFVPGQLLMRFTANTSTARRNQILAQEGATILKSYQTVPVLLVDLPDHVTNIVGAAGYWTAKPEVLYAEPNYIHNPFRTPNDSRFSEKWDLHNTGQPGGTQPGGTAGADIDAVAAWDIFTGTKDVVIAIIDTGTDTTHPDLVQNLWVNPGEIPGNGIDDDGNGYVDDINGWDFVNNDANPEDNVGHGTHVAGIAGAKGNNAVGVTGVAWDASLMILKAGDPGFPLAAEVGAIDYATTMRTRYGINVVVSNNSYGGYNYSQALYDAIAAHTAAGIVFVAAAGNDANNNDTTPSYPDGYNLPGIIAVAATDNRDQMASFSNYGATTVDLGAPGVQILSTV
ncbi:MAG: hypothetical protein FJ276_24965, partial [Planctomycetes bacterium]|nr:hypothetical protein [Planctomycetota bacterium]